MHSRNSIKICLYLEDKNIAPHAWVNGLNEKEHILKKKKCKYIYIYV